MLHYLIKRILTGIIVLIGASSIVFIMIHIIPGDPVQAMLGESARPADLESLRHALGLDLPLYQQWLEFFNRLFHFDLGKSLYSQRSVSQLLLERVGPTLILATSSLLVALLLALPLGILAALYQGSTWDRIAMTFSVMGIAIPNFWLGPLLILIFSIYLGWLPVSGQSGFSSIILPALTLGTALAALTSRMIRASLLEVLSEDYILAARAKGLSLSYVVIKHALPNALLPVMTVVGIQLGGLLAGAVITETIFSWPGIGLLTIESIQRRDYPVVQGCILFISFTYVLINLLTDLCYVVIDPRVRLEQ